MNYAIQDILCALKRAREAKNLSQRALSKRAGVPQSHISRIESGGVDIRLSSLIELARALDLDLRLIPRKAVPAVDGFVRSTAPVIMAKPAIKEINRTLDVIRDLRALHPEHEALNNLQASLQTIKTLDNVGKELEVLRRITRPVRELQKLMKTSRQSIGVTRLPSEKLEAIEQAACNAQTLRNQLVHAIPKQPSLPQPAYRLPGDWENSND